MSDKVTLVQKERDLKLAASGQKYPLRSGLCLAGFHEGSKPTNREGLGVKTCENYLLCPCSCHSDMDELFELSGKAREAVTNPLYKPVINRNLLPPTVIAPSVISGGEVRAGELISPAPGVVPGDVVREFSDTPTGRAARGQLESFVKAVTDEWTIENYATGTPVEKQLPCTLNYISDRISEMQGVAPPQLGGINSVLQRWVEQGIAVISFKPTRFSAYTADAIEYGMEYLRERARRNR